MQTPFTPNLNEEQAENIILQQLREEEKLRRRRNGQTFLYDLMFFCNVPNCEEDMDYFRLHLNHLIKQGKVVRYVPDGTIENHAGFYCLSNSILLKEAKGEVLPPLKD